MSGSAQTQVLPALKNILYATDFSSASLAALPYVRALALRHGATVHLVHAIAPEAKTMVPMDRLPELDLEQRNAEAAMKALLAGDTFQGIPCTSTLDRGEIWNVLDSVVKSRGIDLIVLGTHGRSGLKKLVLGSTAEEVFRRASCPVLTIGPHVSIEPAATAEESPILYATDFSASAQNALPYAVSLARTNCCRLILLHAVPPVMQTMTGNIDGAVIDLELSAQLEANALDYARRQMAEAVAPASTCGVNPELLVESGEAATSILSHADELKAGLIVLGAHRASSHSIASHLPWHTASAVICRARCPVLTVCS